MEKLLCKDCKHSFISWADRFNFMSRQYAMRCRKNYKEEEDDGNLVTGSRMTPAHFERCGTSRIQSAKCGEEGKWWQPKNKKDLFKYIRSIKE